MSEVNYLIKVGIAFWPYSDMHLLINFKLTVRKHTHTLTASALRWWKRIEKCSRFCEILI